MDAIKNAFSLDIITEPYADLRKLGNKLEGATNFDIQCSQNLARWSDALALRAQQSFVPIERQQIWMLGLDTYFYFLLHVVHV